MTPKRLVPIERRAKGNSQARLAAAIGARPGECPLAAFGHMARHGFENLGGRCRTNKSFECRRVPKIGIDTDSSLIAPGHVNPIS